LLPVFSRERRLHIVPRAGCGSAAAGRGLRARAGCPASAPAGRRGRGGRRHRRRLAARGALTLAYCPGSECRSCSSPSARPGRCGRWPGCAGTCARTDQRRRVAGTRGVLLVTGMWSQLWRAAVLDRRLHPADLMTSDPRGNRHPEPSTASRQPGVPETPTQGAENPDSRKSIDSPGGGGAPEGRGGFGVCAQHLAWAGHMRTALCCCSCSRSPRCRGLLPQRSLNPAKITSTASNTRCWPGAGPAGLLRRLRQPLVRGHLPAAVRIPDRLPRPETLEYARACRAQSGGHSAHLNRLPHHAGAEVDGSPKQAVARYAPAAGWRTAVREEPDAEGRASYTCQPRRGTCARPATWSSTWRCWGCSSGSAAGKLFGYEGQVIVLTGGNQFCNSGILATTRSARAPWWTAPRSARSA